MLFSTPRRALAAAAIAFQLINCAGALPAPALTEGSLSSNVTDKSSDLFNRDVFSDLRGAAGNGPSLKSTGTRPAGAVATTLLIGASRLFAWHSKTPNDVRDAEAVVIVLHGVNKNVNTYFKVINDAFLEARDAGIAPANTIRLAPLFMSSTLDRAAMEGSNWLGWSEPSRWASGDMSASPRGSQQSVFAVFDALLARYSDKSRYPNVRSITLVGHGLGAQVISRVAVLARPVGVDVRYVVANPSSQLFFTRDRPVEVDARCKRFNEFRYGLERMPFSVGLSAVQLFKRFARRDVRYMIASDDTADDGDQLWCGGRTAGRQRRADRSYAYFKYLGLLGGANPSDYDAYTGRFPALDSRQRANARIPTSSQATLAPFKAYRPDSQPLRLYTIMMCLPLSAVRSVP